MIRLIVSLALVLAVGLGASACGKKGDLQPPPDKKEERRS